MADDVILNSGSGGATAAADDIGGIHHQRVKISVGADGSASDAIPVSVGMDTTAAGVLAAGIVAQLDDVATNAVTENQFAPVRLSTRRALLVEGVASGTAIPVSAASLPLPSGAGTSAKQDTIIGHLDGVEGLLTTIDGDTGTLAGAVAGSEMQVDIVAALPAGNNNIGDIDVASIIPGTGATNLGKAEDALHASGDVGVMALVVRKTALTDLSAGGTDGDYVPLQVDANGSLQVVLPAGSLVVVDAATVVEDNVAGASPSGYMQMMVRSDVLASNTTTDGDVVATRGTDKGELYVKHVDTIPVTQSGTWDEVGINDSGNSITVDNAQLSIVGSGTEAAALRVTIATDSTGVLSIDDNGGIITVDGTVAVTGVSTLAEQQTQTTALQLIDDIVYVDDTATHATGTSKGALIMGAAVPTDTSVSANDIGAVGMTTDRRLYTEATIAAAQTLATVTTVSTVTALGAGTTGPMKAEDVGHATGDQGFPAWGVRVDSPITAPTNTDGDYTYIATNKLGSVRTAALEDDLATAATKHVYKYYTNAGSVTDGIIWSTAAGTRWFLTSLTINISAAATVTIEDDVAAGDVVRFKFEFAANSGIHMTFPVPMFSGEDAADLLITTTAGNVYVTAVGYEI